MVLKNLQISPQYIKKDPITVTILDVVSPVHFVLKESPTTNASSEGKQFLEAEESMQKYYESIEPGFFQLPLKDTIIVVYHEKKFYRARVIRILTQTVGHLFKVYLVDYGVECSVQRNCIYEIEKDFLDHPFQAVDMKLLGIEPISLIMNTTDLSMSYGPVTYWDPSSEIYIHDLLKGMCYAFIEVKAVGQDCIYGSLFMTFEDNTIKCVNDELISNSFARFSDSCWEMVYAIEDILEGNIPTESSGTATSKEISPEKMSSLCDSSLETESTMKDFRTAFITPDGRVVATSFTQETTPEPLCKVEENLKPQVQEKPLGVLPETSEEISVKQKSLTQKRFQMLQMLNRKRNSSSGIDREEAAGKSTHSIKDSKNVKKNPLHDVKADESEANLTKQNIPEREKALSGNFSSDGSSNTVVNGIRIQPRAVNEACSTLKAETKSVCASPSQFQASAAKRFQQLQELCKKRNNPHVQTNVLSTQNKNVPNIKNNSHNIPFDKIKNSTVSSNENKEREKCHDTNESSECNGAKSSSLQPRDSKDPDCAETSESNSKQKCVSEAQSIERKILFEKLQLLNRRKHPPPPLQIHSPKTVCKSPSPAKDNIMNNVDSSFSSSVDKNENTLVKLNKSESEIIHNDFISSGNSIISNDRHANSSNICSRAAVPNEIACAAAERSIPKQESKQVVTSRNLRNLEILQQRVRMKKKKLELVQASEKTSDDLQTVKEADKGSADSPSDKASSISRNSDYFTSKYPVESSLDKGFNQEQKSSPTSLHQGVVDMQKVKTLIEKCKKKCAVNETKLGHETALLKTPGSSVCLRNESSPSGVKTVASSSSSPVQEPKIRESPGSITNESPTRKTEKIKSFSDKSENRSESDSLDALNMQPRQSKILNEILAMSDSDDLLCSMSNKKDERIDDKSDV